MASRQTLPITGEQMPSNRVDHACEDCGAVRSIEKKRLKTAKYCKTCSNKHKWDGRRYPSGVASDRFVRTRTMIAASHSAHCTAGYRDVYIAKVAAHHARHLRAGRYPANIGDVRQCVICGQHWHRPYGYGPKTVCSDECQAELLRKHKRRGKALRRARLRGTDGESFDPLDIFRRDGWKCQACGCWTPEELRGTQHCSAPELDHVVPVSKGGEHTISNTQCLCRTCNQLKADMSMEAFEKLYV